MRNPLSKNNILDRAFMRVAFVVALVEFFQVGSGLIDGIITSRMLGTDAMAAIGIDAPLFSIAGVISGTIASGITSLSAERIGRGDYKTFNKIGSVALSVGCVFAVLLTVLVACFSGSLASLFGARGNSEELHELSRQYILGISIGMPALVMGPVLAPLAMLDNDSRSFCLASIISALTDVALDFAAAKMGMGVFGMGLASSISYYVYVAVLLLHFARRDKMLHPRFSFNDFKTVASLAYTGSNTAVKYFSCILRPIIINNYIVALGGTMAVTALTVHNNVFSFAYIFGAGIAGGLPVIMGVVYAEKSRRAIVRVGRFAHRVTYIIVGIVSVLCAVLAYPIALFFVGKNSEGLWTVVFAVLMISGELILSTLLNARISYLAVLTKMLGCDLLQLGLELLAVVPCVLIMGRLFGVLGVLSGTLVGYAVLIFAVYLVTAIRKKKAKVGMDDYLRLDSSFNIPPYDIIELDVRSREDASLISEQVQMFCKGHKLDTKKSFYAALALEETVNLVFENNGVRKDLKMDVRLAVNNGEIILRVRDNGVLLYPFGERPGDLTDDAVSRVGVKMVRKIAKEIKYYDTMDMNYVVLVI